MADEKIAVECVIEETRREIESIQETRDFLQNYLKHIHENNPDFKTEIMLFRAEGLLGLYQKIDEHCLQQYLKESKL